MNHLQAEFEQLQQCGVVGCLDYPVQFNGIMDFLHTEIDCQSDGIDISFNSHNLPVAFKNRIKTVSANCYFLPFTDDDINEMYDDLNSQTMSCYLKYIDDNIRYGFIAINQLQINED